MNRERMAPHVRYPEGEYRVHGVHVLFRGSRQPVYRAAYAFQGSKQCDHCRYCTVSPFSINNVPCVLRTGIAVACI